MYIIGLWNAEYLAGQYPALTSTVVPNAAVLMTNEVTPANFFTWSTMIGWMAYPVNGRNYLRIQCMANNYNTVAYFTLCPALNASQYTELRAKGVKRLYYGLRVRTGNIKTGAYLITVSGVNYAPAVSNSEYYVEAVCNLENNTRTIYVNGAVVNIPVTNDLVAVGNYQQSMFTSSAHTFWVNDYYFAASADPTPPVRLGKMLVNTLLPVAVDNASKFKVVGSTGSIAEVLSQVFSEKSPSTLTKYVESDSNGSKMEVSFAPPPAGTIVAGVSFRASGMKKPEAQAWARVDAGDGMRTLSISTTDMTASMTYHHPFSITPPQEGWNADRLAAVRVKLWSERSV